MVLIRDQRLFGWALLAMLVLSHPLEAKPERILNGTCRIKERLDGRFLASSEFKAFRKNPIEFDLVTKLEEGGGHWVATAKAEQPSSQSRILPYRKTLPSQMSLRQDLRLSTASHVALTWKDDNLFIQLNMNKVELESGRLTGACMVIFGPNSNPPIWGKF